MREWVPVRAKNWSVNLETEEYARDRALIVADAIEAVERTAPGYRVNVAVAPDHGNPDGFLVPALKERFGEAVSVRFVDQCGCGGYVYRIEKGHEKPLPPKGMQGMGPRPGERNRCVHFR